MADPEKKKAPVLDQAQAMSAQIPGALQSSPVVVDVPVDVAAAAPTPAESVAPPLPPMLVDVPIHLPEVIPDAEPDDGRPASDAHKDVWAAWAIERGVPSYEAWAMTLPELKKLES